MCSWMLSIDSWMYCLGIASWIMCCSLLSHLHHFSLRLSSMFSSQFVFPFHVSCIIILALTLTGSMNPSGSNNLDDRLSAARFVSFVVLVLRISLHSSLSGNVSVSVSVFHVSPKTLTVDSTYTSSDCAWSFSDVQLLDHCLRFMLALLNMSLDDV